MLDYAVGCREAATGGSFLKRLIHPWVDEYITDVWEVYPMLIPWERYIVSKTQMYSVEGKKSLIRYGLARFGRKSKYDSKAIDMIQCFLNLLFFKLNYKYIPI